MEPRPTLSPVRHQNFTHLSESTKFESLSMTGPGLLCPAKLGTIWLGERIVDIQGERRFPSVLMSYIGYITITMF